MVDLNNLSSALKKGKPYDFNGMAKPEYVKQYTDSKTGETKHFHKPQPYEGAVKPVITMKDDIKIITIAKPILNDTKQTYSNNGSVAGTKSVQEMYAVMMARYQQFVEAGTLAKVSTWTPKNTVGQNPVVVFKCRTNQDASISLSLFLSLEGDKKSTASYEDF